MNHFVLWCILSVGGVAACAQNIGHTNAVLVPASAVRVIVQFHPSMQGDGSVLVQRLQAQTQAQVHYIASVMGNTHVYGFELVPGQTLPQLLQMIRAMPEVERVEFDQKVVPH